MVTPRWSRPERRRSGCPAPDPPLQTTTWGAWLAEHPETTTVDFETGYSYRDRVNLGASGIRGTFLETLGDLDPRLPENELVIGVLAGDGAVAFPIANVPAEEPMQAEVGGVPVVIFEDIEGMPALAYHRLLTDGTVLDFERREGAIYDLQTGSQWGASGRALEGDLAGVQLAFVTSFFTEWYGWAGLPSRDGHLRGRVAPHAHARPSRLIRIAAKIRRYPYVESPLPSLASLEASRSCVGGRISSYASAPRTAPAIGPIQYTQ